jgi:HlyD family secretion protein
VKKVNMKIVIIAVVLALAGGAAYWFFKPAKTATQPIVTGKVERGDIRLSVISQGKVVSNLDVEIKCKASGEIITLPFDISQHVNKGDLLLELDPVDEQREVNQSQVSLSSSQAKLEIAKKNLLVAQHTLDTDRMRAESSLKSYTVAADDARTRLDRTKELLSKKLISQEEADTAVTSATQADSNRDLASVKLEELKTQEESLELYRQQVNLAEAQVKSDIINHELVQQALTNTKVISPMDGVVTANNVQKGQIVSSGISNVGGGTTIMTLSDLSQIFVIAAVDESDIGKVKLGQEVIISVDAFPGRKFNGQVTRIATKGVNTSNVVTFEVKIEVLGNAPAGRAGKGLKGSRPTDADKSASRPTDMATATSSSSSPAEDSSQPARHRGRRDAGEASSSQASSRPGGDDDPRNLLKPEMTANVEIISSERKGVLLVPSEAIILKQGNNFATVLADGLAPQEVPVEVGITDGSNTEVISGLSDGQAVQIFKGSSNSKWQGQQPQMSPNRMMGGGGPGGGGGGRGGR